MIRLLVAAALLAGCAAGTRAGAPAKRNTGPAAKHTAAEDSAFVDSLATVAHDSTRLEEFLSEFERCVHRHDKPALVSLLDPTYRAKQLTRIYNDNPDPFLNTLICGKVLASDQYYCLDFDAIYKFDRKAVAREGEAVRVVAVGLGADDFAAGAEFELME